jgi:hypothetical protein
MKYVFLAYPDLQPRSTLSLPPPWDWPPEFNIRAVLLMTDRSLSALDGVWEGALGRDASGCGSRQQA